MCRIYWTVSWTTWLTLNFIENKMAARWLASQSWSGSRQNKYSKQSYLNSKSKLNNIIAKTKKMRKFVLSLCTSHCCNFQKQFLGIHLLKLSFIFVKFQISLWTKTCFSRTMSDVRPLFQLLPPPPNPWIQARHEVKIYIKTVPWRMIANFNVISFFSYDD